MTPLLEMTGPLISDDPPAALVGLVALVVFAWLVVMAKAVRQVRNPNLRTDEW